jgi:hypothetical protein
VTYDQVDIEHRPVLGSFGLGLSYGLPAGVAVAGGLAVLIDEPDIGILTWVGILVAVGIALAVMTIEKRRGSRGPAPRPQGESPAEVAAAQGQTD